MKEYKIVMPTHHNGLRHACDDGKIPCLPSCYYKGVKTTYGDKPAIMEINRTEICVAMRGRNPENTSDGTAGAHLEQRLEANTQGKTNCLTTVSKDNLIMSCLTPKRTEYGKQIRKQYEAGEISEQRKNIQQLEPREDGKTGTLTTVQKDNLIMERKPIQLNPAKEFGDQPQQQNRYYDVDTSSPAMTCTHPPKIFKRRCRIRRLTPTECARLQSIPDWYEWKGKFPDGSVKPTSDTQIYKMCGNGWNVEVIKHIFSFIDLEAYEKVRKTNDKKE